jgi:hypothetical protein
MDEIEPAALRNREVPLPARCRLALVVGIEEEWLRQSGRRATAEEFEWSLRQVRADALLKGVKYVEEAKP